MHNLVQVVSETNVDIIGGCVPNGKAHRFKIKEHKLDINDDFTCEIGVGGIGGFVRRMDGSLVHDCFQTSMVGPFFVVDTANLKEIGLMWEELPSKDSTHLDFFLHAKELSLKVAMCVGPKFSLEGSTLKPNIPDTTNTISEITSWEIAKWDKLMNKHALQMYVHLFLLMHR